MITGVQSIVCRACGIPIPRRYWQDREHPTMRDCQTAWLEARRTLVWAINLYAIEKQYDHDNQKSRRNS